MQSPLANSVEFKRKPSGANIYLDSFESPPLTFTSFDDSGNMNLEVLDSDLAHHDDILDEIVQQTKSATKAHLIAVKKRLLEEKQIALNKAESEYLQQYGALCDDINSLKSDIIALDSAKEEQAVKYEGTIDRLSLSILTTQRKFTSEFSLQKMFHSWKEFSLSSCYLRKLEKTASYFSRRQLLSRTLSTIRINCQLRRSANFQAESKFKFDQVTSEMISKYESELAKLHEDLAEAYSVAQQETHKRQQMEEDLRRMFLKNMTNLNMEALSLFQTAYNAPSALDSEMEPSDSAVHRQISGKKPTASNGKNGAVSANGHVKSSLQKAASAKQAQDYVSSLQQPHQAEDVITSSNLVGMASYHAPQDELDKIRKLKELQLQQQYQQTGLTQYYSPKPKGGVMTDDGEYPRPALQSKSSFVASASSLSAAYNSDMATTTKLANNVRNTPPAPVSKNVPVITSPLTSKCSPNSQHHQPYRPPPAAHGTLHLRK